MHLALLSLLPLAALAAASAALDHANLVGPYSALPELDCAIRQLALDYSRVATPWADASLVSDALRLPIDCNATRPAPAPRVPTSAALPAAAAGATFFADAVAGSDANAGTEASPFATVARALAATRAAAARPAAIVLRAGTFYLPATLELGPADSGLSIAAYPGEAPVLSGGAPLAGLAWAPVPPPPSPPPPPPMQGPFTGSIINSCVDAPGASNPGVCGPLVQGCPTAAACAAACLNASACTGYTWHDGSQGGWALWCYARLDGQHALNGASGHVAGWKPPGPPADLNIQAATLPAGLAPLPFDQLYLRGRRLTRARFPNANPETQMFPDGFAGASGWVAPAAFPPPNETHVDGVKPEARDFPNFQWGTGGTVANFTTGSFWGTRSPPAGAQYVVPTGVELGAEAPAGGPGAWSRVRGAVLHTFQGGFWGSWQFVVGGVAGNSTLMFEAGGWQEARGASRGNYYYVENVPELLDEAGEWYFDSDARELRIAFNGTAAAGNETLVAAQLAELVRLTGDSPVAPVTDVSLVGLTFAHTLTDYMLPYTVPSGGDMSFHDGGMVRLSNTARVAVQNCSFAAPGGNGLMISGFNRATVVRGCEFSYTGANAIMSAGLGGGLQDAGAPAYPEGTLLESNVGREIGMYVKQAGFFYEAVSANFTARANVVFNAARAAINVNDGAFGGHLLEKNLLFNTVRETHDHGAYNSWDRQPYVWRAGVDAAVPLPIYIRRNFIINSYNGVWGLCHDDGSNGYIDENNFLPWSGTKNYLGYNKTSRGNWFIYSDVSPVTASGRHSPLKNGWNSCAMSYGGWAGDLPDHWFNNTCITSSVGKAQFDSNSCNAAAPTDGAAPLFSNNSYANPDSDFKFLCGKASWTLAEAQAQGVEVGSRVIPLPTTADIIAAGRSLLEF